jgi:hypothetical protein
VESKEQVDSTGQALDTEVHSFTKTCQNASPLGTGMNGILIYFPRMREGCKGRGKTDELFTPTPVLLDSTVFDPELHSTCLQHELRPKADRRELVAGHQREGMLVWATARLDTNIVRPVSLYSDGGRCVFRTRAGHHLRG